MEYSAEELLVIARLVSKRMVEIRSKITDASEEREADVLAGISLKNLVYLQQKIHEIDARNN
jgi:cell division protein ZapA (FtsZ GTPase activity inhibitor)